MYKTAFLSAFIIFLSFFGYSQNLSSAKKVYYTPIQEKIYFAINMNPVSEDSIRGKGGMIINTLIKVDKESPIYEVNGDYSVGDVLRILVYADPYGVDPSLYTYIKIVGSVDSGTIETINNKIRSSASEIFGEGKLEEWPEKFIDEKSLGRKVPNEKSVDSDYYILSKIENFTPKIELLIESYNVLNTSTKGDASNLIIFQHARLSDNKWVIKEVDNFASSYFKIEIKFKEKSGKKGKKIGSANAMNLSTEQNIVTDSYEMEIDATIGEYSKYVNAWISMDQKSVELVETNQNIIKHNIIMAIEKAFGKIK